MHCVSCDFITVFYSLKLISKLAGGVDPICVYRMKLKEHPIPYEYIYAILIYIHKTNCQTIEVTAASKIMTTKADPSDYDTLYQSNTGYIVPTITGTISCASSAVVIFIILRSMRNTAYHRIMLAMSLSDVLSSTAIALTTIPMPSDVIYAYAGSSYGTTGTCVAQGLAYTIGGSLVVSASCTLHIYYLCKLGFKMPEPTFRKRVEPVCFLIFVPWSIIFPFLTLRRNDLINPTPYESYCSISHYPYKCQKYDDVECIRGDNSFPVSLTLLINLGFSVCFGTMLTSMLIIICKFYKIERAARRFKNVASTMVNAPIQKCGGDVEDSDQGGGDIIGGATNEALSYCDDEAINSEDLQYGLTKDITIQASMYISAFILTWVFTILTLIETSPNTFPFAEMESFQVLKVIFQPLQGFFNMLIFIYHKVSQIRRADLDRGSAWDLLKIVFGKPRTIPEIVISRIEVVHFDLQRLENILEIVRYSYDEDGQPHHSEVSSSPEHVSENGLALFDIDRAPADTAGIPPKIIPQLEQNTLDPTSSGVQERNELSSNLSYEQDSKSNLSGFSWHFSRKGDAGGSR